MENVQPKCSLCGSTEEVGHILSVIATEERETGGTGGHIHICKKCREARFPKELLKQTEKINQEIFNDMKQFRQKSYSENKQEHR